MEILVLDIAQSPTQIPIMTHPAVRHIYRPHCRSYSEAKVIALRQARTGIVAFIEDHARPEPGWAEAVLEAFTDGVGSVVYTYCNLNPRNRVSRSFMLHAYGRWMDSRFSGKVTDGPANNIAYRLQALEGLEDRLSSYFDIEYNLHQWLQRQQWRMMKSAKAVVAHENFVTLRQALYDIHVHSQLLAVRRATLGNWSLFRRMIYAAGMGLMPPLHMWRLARRVWQNKALRAEYLKLLPFLTLFAIQSALSEGIGYYHVSAALGSMVMANETRIIRDPK